MKLLTRDAEFLPSCDRARLGIPHSRIQACKSDCPMAATLLHQNRKRKNHEKIQTPTPGSTVLVSFYIKSSLSHRICTCTACTLAAPTHPLHYTGALDSVIEARYVLWSLDFGVGVFHDFSRMNFGRND